MLGSCGPGSTCHSCAISSLRKEICNQDKEVLRHFIVPLLSKDTYTSLTVAADVVEDDEVELASEAEVLVLDV